MIKRLYYKIRVFFKIIKAFYFPKKLIETWYCIEEFTDGCIIFKSNPYYFYNMGNLMITKKGHCNYPKLDDNYIFFPVPIYNNLFRLCNDLRRD